MLAILDVCQDQRRLNPKIVSGLSVFVLLVLQVSWVAVELWSLGEKVIRVTHLTPHTITVIPGLAREIGRKVANTWTRPEQFASFTYISLILCLSFSGSEQIKKLHHLGSTPAVQYSEMDQYSTKTIIFLGWNSFNQCTVT